MHVCVLTDGYPPWERGGAQKIAAQLARGYSERGHRVSAITTVDDRRERGRSREHGVDVHRLYTPKPRALLPYLTVYNPFVVPRCRRLLDRLTPDVVHAHNCHWLSNGAVRAAADGRPVVETFHDAGTVAYGDFTAFLDRVPVGRGRVPRPAYEVDPLRQARDAGLRYNPLRNRSNRRHRRRYVDHGVAVSRELRRGLAANGIAVDETLHNGVDVAAWEDGDGAAFRRRHGLGEARIVLFGGRTGYAKGGAHLARAFAGVADAVDDPVRLVVTGDDGYVPAMRRLARPHGDAVVATGWIDPGEYRDALAAATVVASPSVFLDPFPTVNLEAFAAGTPVVTSRFGGARELVDHGEDGYVVDPRDVDELAAALRRLLADPDRAAAFGQAGRREVSASFGLSSRVDAYLDRLLAVTDAEAGRREPADGAE